MDTKNQTNFDTADARSTRHLLDMYETALALAG